MKILIEENRPLPKFRDNEDMRKIAAAYDGLKPNTSLFIPSAEISGKWKDMKAAAMAIRAGIKKRTISKNTTVVVKEFGDGVRIWKKL